ncbi:hypothetical protein COLO4_01935 [Corchorus olitorius]|uniref:Uncharacterized protein n=1 Tax=Corchorus olitorius TaxID=93759 RepID=A0A1R3L1X3_9ROSI|nr:hypothetical protein COLO4_01935 [Corchorus olitorius]
MGHQTPYYVIETISNVAGAANNEGVFRYVPMGEGPLTEVLAEAESHTERDRAIGNALNYVDLLLKSRQGEPRAVKELGYLLDIYPGEQVSVVKVRVMRVTPPQEADRGAFRMQPITTTELPQDHIDRIVEVYENLCNNDFFSAPVNMVDHFGLLYVGKRVDISIEVYSASTDELLVTLPLTNSETLDAKLAERLAFSLGSIYDHLVDPKTHYYACKMHLDRIVTNTQARVRFKDPKTPWEMVYTDSHLALRINWDIEEGYRINIRRNPFSSSENSGVEKEFEAVLSKDLRFMDLIKSRSPYDLGKMLNYFASY